MSSNVVLYDLASKGRNACWTPNPWKARMALNYKGIDYTTVFLDFPEIQPTLKSLQLPPNDSGAIFEYTVPTLQFPDGTCVMDSKKIARKMDEVWPDKPSLHVDSPVLPQVERGIMKILGPMMAILIDRIRRHIVKEATIPYYEQARAKHLGKSIDQFLAESPGVDGAWANAKGGIDELATLLKAQGGPFFLGNTVSFADFHLAGCCAFLKRLGEGLLEKFLSFDPVFPAHFNACQPWLQRDD